MPDSIITAVENFSKKLGAFKKSENAKRVVPVSSDKKLQQKILESEEEKVERVIAEYKKFSEPVSKEVEQDEESLLKAYELFKAASDLNERYKSSGVVLKDLFLNSSLCRKESYKTKTAEGGKLIYLQCWFYFEKKNTEHLPFVETGKSGETYLTFKRFGEIRMFSSEKEIWETVASLY